VPNGWLEKTDTVSFVYYKNMYKTFMLVLLALILSLALAYDSYFSPVYNDEGYHNDVAAFAQAYTGEDDIEQVLSLDICEGDCTYEKWKSLLTEGPLVVNID
jgi:hypothetical protein